MVRRGFWPVAQRRLKLTIGKREANPGLSSFRNAGQGWTSPRETV